MGEVVVRSPVPEVEAVRSHEMVSRETAVGEVYALPGMVVRHRTGREVRVRRPGESLRVLVEAAQVQDAPQHPIQLLLERVRAARPSRLLRTCPHRPAEVALGTVVENHELVRARRPLPSPATEVAVILLSELAVVLEVGLVLRKTVQCLEV